MFTLTDVLVVLLYSYRYMFSVFKTLIKVGIDIPRPMNCKRQDTPRYVTLFNVGITVPNGNIQQQAVNINAS